MNGCRLPSGFRLVTLLVAVAIIAILASMLFPLVFHCPSRPALNWPSKAKNADYGPHYYPWDPSQTYPYCVWDLSPIRSGLWTTVLSASGSGNLALGKTVTVSSAVGWGPPGSFAVDGNTNTRWSSEGGVDPQWIYVDLGSTYSINKVILNWEVAYGKSYQIHVSGDAVNWNTVHSTASGDGGIDDISFASTNARYVRMYGTARGTPWGYSLWEFEVHSDSPGDNLALGKPVTVSDSDKQVRAPEYAVDGKFETAWAAPGTDPQWIYVDLGSTCSIGRVILRWEAAYGGSYQIQVSSNTVNWTDVYWTKSGDGGIDDISFAQTDARYVRMYGVRRGTGWGWSLWEFEVYSEPAYRPAPAPAPAPTPVSASVRDKQFIVRNKYLVIPIENDPFYPNQHKPLRLYVDNKEVRRYDLILAKTAQEADWYAHFSIEKYMGKQARVETWATEEGFALVQQSDTIPGEENFYKEPHRPQFHFTQKVGWNNDLNGLVYHNGTYHLFYQHNPVGLYWAQMTWGHATSTDLLHWKQQPIAIHRGTMAKGDAWSGSAAVDKLNTAGWGANTLVAFFTDTGAGESIVYSTDNGSTFTYYENNPVAPPGGRDPKVVWYKYDDADTPLNSTAAALGGHWVMARHGMSFWTSADMKDWTLQSELPGYHECPEIFELPVDGKNQDTRWVVYGVDAQYAIGQFEGRTFTPEHKGKHRAHYGPYYASQTFNNTPDGRRIQMGCVPIPGPGPYQQHISFPHRLTLRTTTDGIRMFAEPIAEIAKLHGTKRTIPAGTLSSGVAKATSVRGQQFDIRVNVRVGTADEVVISASGLWITYDAVKQQLNVGGEERRPLNRRWSTVNVPLAPVNGVIGIQMLVDNSLMEIVGNNGRVFITAKHGYQGTVDQISITANGGSAYLNSFEAHEVNSIWGN